MSPAIVKTATWDVVAWNRAAAVILTDYSRLEPRSRNILRLMFTSPHARAAQADWSAVARFVVGAFRADAVRAGASDEVARLVEELSELSAEFAALWRANDVSPHGEGLKRLHHPVHGALELEFSTFAVDGRPDLGMMVYTPATPADAERIRRALAASSAHDRG